MNRKQRRTMARRTNREAVPICYLLYSPETHSYLNDVDPETTTLRFTDEDFATAITNREDALEMVKYVRIASGLRLAIQPRYLPFYH